MSRFEIKWNASKNGSTESKDGRFEITKLTSVSLGNRYNVADTVSEHGCWDHSCETQAECKGWAERRLYALAAEALAEEIREAFPNAKVEFNSWDGEIKVSPVQQKGKK